MNIFKRIYDNWIVRNLLWGIVFVTTILLAVNIFMHVFTQHSRYVTVPDLVGKTLEQARAEVASEDITLIVTDSVFVKRFRRGCVYAQNPKAGDKVKRGRKFYITMNASREKQVAMPDLVGLSLRQAKVELTSRGLKLGRLSYVNDIATNNVLAQTIDNEVVEGGRSVDVGTTVNLQLGLDPDDAYSMVPDLTGYRYQRAISTLQDNSFNISRTVFDATVKTYSDSLAAFVYSQEPSAKVENVRLGTAVKIYLTLDESKLPKIEEEPVESEAE